MSGTYGLTDEGFVTKPFEDVLTDIQEEYKATWGAAINLAAQSNFGQLSGIDANLLADIWALLLAVYNSQYPDTASGASLDNVCSITGTVREQPAPSTVTATLTGTPSTTIPAGTVFSVTGAGTKFQTDADVTLDGSGNGTVACTAQETGPKACNTGTLTVIETPVAGLSTVTNAADGVLGTDLETDAALRARREDELRATGNAAVEAIREKVLAVDSVTDCYVFENPTDAVDGNGTPAHAVEVVVAGGTDANVAAAIFASKAAGIATAGSTTQSVTDSQGIAHSVKFTRPTPVNIYVVVSLVKNSLWNLSTAPQATKDAILAYAALKYLVGKSVVDSQLYVPVFSVPGVEDITSLYIGTAPAPGTPGNISITLHQIAKFDSSRITINVT
jgi:uncharacterized phage protein gp47/JayE